MNKELEEAITLFKEVDMGNDTEFIKARETILNYIENSIPKKVIEEKYLKMEKEYRKKVYDKRYDRYEAKVEEMYKAQVYRELLEVE